MIQAIGFSNPRYEQIAVAEVPDVNLMGVYDPATSINYLSWTSAELCRD